MIGSGMIVIKPFHDFPNDLPIINALLEDQHENATLLNETLLDNRPYSTAEQAGTSTHSIQYREGRRQQRTHVTSNTPVPTETANVILLRELSPDIEYEEEERTPIQDLRFPKLEENSLLEVIKTKKDLDHCRLSVIFKNEEGVDGGGLTNELFTVFWTQAFSSFQYFQGRDALVPHTPLHKLRKLLPDFQILAKILSHMIITVGQFPNRLALYVLYGIADRPKEEYSEKLLLQDFFY
ncbi:hypothetical protein FQR65_LT18638 [Abscondita terminalis]|nr:hypothetical protein FQR65_LT18638 [Abscondita terminalis]